jgi:RNA polymerase sigma-70 factor (ECF subfamily)
VRSDAELLYAWRAGDTEAGQRLFKRYYGPVARFFANKIREAPGDLVQQTFVATVEGRDRLRDDGNFRSYLFGVAYRVLTGYLRRKYEAPDDLASISVCDLDPGPSTIMHRSEEVRLLLAALRTLPLDLQVVVELRYWEQMNSTEISQVLGIPAATVRTRLRSGRTSLHEALRTLTSSPDLLQSTTSDIDGWARKVREGVQSSPTAKTRGP